MSMIPPNDGRLIAAVNQLNQRTGKYVVVLLVIGQKAQLKLDFVGFSSDLSAITALADGFNKLCVYFEGVCMTTAADFPTSNVSKETALLNHEARTTVYKGLSKRIKAIVPTAADLPNGRNRLFVLVNNTVPSNGAITEQLYRGYV